MWYVCMLGRVYVCVRVYECDVCLCVYECVHVCI